MKPAAFSYNLMIAFITLTCLSCAESKKFSTNELYKTEILTPIHSFTAGVEGPAVDKHGALYAVNFAKEGTIGKTNPSTGQCEIFVELPNGSIGNGIRFATNGHMFIADYVNHNILKVDMSTKQLSVWAHEPHMNQPNDIAIDSKGRLYASDPNWKDNTGKLWRIDLNGKTVLLEEKMGTTNGVEVSPDDQFLYVNESVQRKVWVYDLAADGSISNKRLLLEFPDFGMDGMRCDIDGNLYIARYGKGTIAQVSPSGKLIREIALLGKKPTNIAFGGHDGKTAYVTLQDQGNIETFRVEKPGREWKLNR